MSSQLQKIIEAKREEIARRTINIPLARLKDTIATLGRPRNFFNAVTRQPVGKLLNLIAQIDPAALTRTSAASSADALSVLTHESFGPRGLDRLRTVRDAVKLPVLRDDLILDAYQIYESRACGADAVLLIAECLETSQMIDLQILATELNMTSLIEVHDLEHLMRVRDAVIGFPHRSYSLLVISNRDLQTGTIDIGTTLRMAELVEDRGVLVSSGGITTHTDLEKLASVGVRAAIIAMSEMKT